MREKLVVIGNGMAAGRALEELFERAPGAYEVTIFGAEPRVNYNRIMLSPVLSGEKTYEDILIHDDAWYEANGITLHRGKQVVEIDRAAKRVIAADGKSALGGAPTMAILDERGHWALDRGDELEAALLSGLGKRSGRAFLISTSASDDTHPFSRWIDDPVPGSYVQEHRPPPGLPADDRPSLIMANPGAEHGIGASVASVASAGNLPMLRP